MSAADSTSNNYKKLSEMVTMRDITDDANDTVNRTTQTIEDYAQSRVKQFMIPSNDRSSNKSNDLDSFNSYDGSVHEVVPVSYIGSGGNITARSKEIIIVDEDDSVNDDNGNKAGAGDETPLIIQDKTTKDAEQYLSNSKETEENSDHEYKAKLNQRFGSFKFVKKSDSVILSKQNSFKLGVPKKGPDSVPSSVASGHVASGSDYSITTPMMSEKSTFSSHNQDSKPIRRLNIDRQPTIKTIESAQSSEPEFVVDSNVSKLQPSKDQSIRPNRMETNDLKPSIPARSRDRPNSGIYSVDKATGHYSSPSTSTTNSKSKRASLDFMHAQLGEQMEELKSIVSQHGETDDPVQVKAEHNPAENMLIKDAPTKKTKSNTSDKEVPVIARDGQASSSNHSSNTKRASTSPDDDDFYSAVSEYAENNSSKTKSVSDKRQSMAKSMQEKNVPFDDSYLDRPVPKVPQPKLPIETTPELEDDEYEDIETPSKQPAKNLSTNMSRNSIRTGKSKNTTASKKSNKKEIRSAFDIDTLAQLLSVTKGTMIGSEFANLGMKAEEKMALEKLVDSLSRLTSDMILDPERYEEGLKRLKKATRALEGF